MKAFSKLNRFAAIIALWALANHGSAADDWRTVDDWSGGSAVNGTSDQSGKLFVVGGNIIRRSSDGGQTWTNVDISPGKAFHAVATDHSTNVFAVCSSHDQPDPGPWVVRRSSDGGDSWTETDRFIYADSGPGRNVPTAVAEDKNDVVYVVGYCRTGTAYDWLVRRSLDGGNTWDTVDIMSGGFARAVAVTTNAVFVAGTGTDYSTIPNSNVLVIRRSVDGGESWDTVDSLENVAPLGMTADTSGNVYVVKLSQGIRKSVDGGETWMDLPFTGGAFSIQSAEAAATLLADAAGRLWLATRSPFGVQLSTDGGVSWQVSDDYGSAISAVNSIAYGAFCDSTGSVFAVGWANINSASHWLVRRLNPGLQLQVSRVDKGLRLSWPTNSTGFVLQSATTLANGGNWQDFPTPPAETNGQNVIAVDTMNTAGFFRLRQP